MERAPMAGHQWLWLRYFLPQWTYPALRQAASKPKVLCYKPLLLNFVFFCWKRGNKAISKSSFYRAMRGLKGFASSWWDCSNSASCNYYTQANTQLLFSKGESLVYNSISPRKPWGAKPAAWDLEEVNPGLRGVLGMTSSSLPLLLQHFTQCLDIWHVTFSPENYLFPLLSHQAASYPENQNRDSYWNAKQSGIFQEEVYCWSFISCWSFFLLQLSSAESQFVFRFYSWPGLTCLLTSVSQAAW